MSDIGDRDETGAFMLHPRLPIADFCDHGSTRNQGLGPRGRPHRRIGHRSAITGAQPSGAKKVEAILATDKDNSWTKTDIAGEATWADVLMDKSTEGRAATAQWHYVKLDAARPDLAKACFGQPELAATTPAIHGP
jgi:hypothetical protein